MRNKRFAKTMIFILTGCLLCTVAGCGVNTATESSSEDTAAVSEEIKESGEKSDKTDSAEVADGSQTTSKENGTTGKNTKTSTEHKTEAATEGKTERRTEAATEGRTERKTESTTESRTEGSTERRTEATTEATTERKTEATTEAPTTEAPSTECQHDWEAVYKDVNHPEEGHYEKVMVEPGYTGPIYEYHEVCNGCGFDYTANGVTPGDHECPDGHTWSWTTKTIVVGYEEIPPEYEERWKVDKPAWVEKVLDYYKCKKCGKRKQTILIIKYIGNQTSDLLKFGVFFYAHLSGHQIHIRKEHG